jgi:hypothetical protein
MWKNLNCFKTAASSFSFENGLLREISGQYTPDLRATAEKTDMSSCVTAVKSFLGEIRKGKYVCTKITSVEPGYRLTISDGSLVPVWRIETDKETAFYIDQRPQITPRKAVEEKDIDLELCA